MSEEHQPEKTIKPTSGGLIDLFCGGGLLCLAFTEFIQIKFPRIKNEELIYISLFIIWTIFIQRIRKHYVHPRMEFAPLKSERKIEQVETTLNFLSNLILKSMIFVVPAILILFFLSITQIALHFLPNAPFSGLAKILFFTSIAAAGILLFFGIIYSAYTQYAPRGYVYAFMIIGWFSIKTYFSGPPHEWNLYKDFLIAGSFLVAIGLILFVRFMRKYPLPKE